MSEQVTRSAARSSDAPGVTAEGETFPSRELKYVKLPPPGPGEGVAVTPGVVWCRIPLPIDLNHINVWLLETDGGCVIVDSGMAAAIAKPAWESIDAAHLVDKPVRAIFITHIHPDHIGLAAWLQERHQAPVLMSKRTHELAAALLGGVDAPQASEAEAFLRAHGISEVEPLRPIFAADRYARLTSGMPQVERFVADGEALGFGASAWTALETNGHAEGHLCLFNRESRVLISGDQVLPSISPNIGLSWRSDDPDPLHSYLASLQRLKGLDESTLVLPSHGRPFQGLPLRADDLRRHHETQLAALEDACREPKAAAEVLRVMFRRELKGMHLFLALSEAVAHLEYLARAGRVGRHRDSAGVIRYSTGRES